MAKIEHFVGDLFWDDDDTEIAVDNPEDYMPDSDRYAIVEFQQAKRLPNFFGANRDIGNGEIECEFFDTSAEAAAWQRSSAHSDDPEGDDPGDGLPTR